MDFVNDDDSIIEDVRGSADHGLQLSREDTIVINELDTVFNRRLQLSLNLILFFGA